MNNFITYILEVNVCILLFGALYYLLLRNETDFKFRRFYLISPASIETESTEAKDQQLSSIQ